MTNAWKNKMLIVVAGPTAVGKTETAIRLAQYFRSEIISADSRQIFKELTIGTAKPSIEELSIVPHHFINTHNISEQYDAAAYGKDALAVIHQLFERNDFVILCGGSGLYIRAVLEGFDEIPAVEPDIRKKITDEYALHGLSWLQQQMKDRDPAHYAVIDQFNPHRLMRALEVVIGTGLSISSYQKKREDKFLHPFRVLKIGLELPREELYRRIEDRMESMISEGLFSEAASLHSYKNLQALQTVGYQEIFDFIEEKYDREEAIRLLKRNSRRYAKRQLTWFKRDKEMQWFAPSQVNEIISLIKEFRISDLKMPSLRD